MEAGEPEAAFCERIEVGGADLAAKGTKIGKAEVVGNDDEDVWLAR